MPGIALAIVGATHPQHLTYATSAHWTVMHVFGVLIFPLLGVALAALVWGRRDPLAIIIVLGSYLYATCYTALDVISGVAAGYVTYQLGPSRPRSDEVRYLFEIGGWFEVAGAWCLLVTIVCVGASALHRHGIPAVVPAVLLAIAGVSFLDSHIFWWRGVLTVFAIGVGTGWLSLFRVRSPAARLRQDPRQT